ncbi:MAG: hypothetical protein Aurels2KO_50450 [Aureliella sp.]
MSCNNAFANDVIPDAFKNQMKRMVGSWVFTGNGGDRKLTGKETIRIVNNGTAIVQEGYFDLDDSKKEHYVILSGWDGEKKTILVRGFTSLGTTFDGAWSKVENDAFVGKAQGKQAKFKVSKQTMIYEEDGGKWTMKFEREK